MKNFYEMMEIMEQDAVPQGGQEVPREQGPQDVEDGLGNEGLPEKEEKSAPEDGGEIKHYMFFSNLKSIKEKVEAMLAMDPREVDAMLDDGHDWASDHIATSKDDVEEVCNWIMGEKK